MLVAIHLCTVHWGWEKEGEGDEGAEVGMEEETLRLFVQKVCVFAWIVDRRMDKEKGRERERERERERVR